MYCCAIVVAARPRKFYLQCLLDLPRCLQLTQRVPSDACQNFYKCLLDGKHVEHNWSDAKCRAALKGVDVQRLPLADGDPLAIVDDGGGGDDELLLAYSSHLPKQARAKKTPIGEVC